MKDKNRIDQLCRSMYELFDKDHNLVSNFLKGKTNIQEFERKSEILGTLLEKNNNMNLKSKLKKNLFALGLKENNYYRKFLKIFRELHKKELKLDQVLEEFLLNSKNIEISNDIFE